MKEVHIMKKTKFLLIAFLVTILLLISPGKVNSVSLEAIFFKSSRCDICKKIEDEDYITKMENQGIQVTIYNILDSSPINEFTYKNDLGDTIQVTAIDLYTEYNTAYQRFDNGVPVLFVGEDYFEGYSEITKAIDRGTVLDLSSIPFLEIDISGGIGYAKLTGILGLLIVLGAGLLDGFNPCAIALLLLFIGLLMGAKDKKVLLAVSITYISALFISYYLIGVLALEILEKYKEAIDILGNVVSWFIITICLILFGLNINDYIQSKNENYGKIKHQLPRFIKKFNKKIVKAYTNLVNPKDKTRGLPFVLILTFILGIVLSITELICTGGIYGGILLGIHSIGSSYAYILLLFYNLMFVLPLIIIAIISIKLKSVVTISNWLRENMSTIKLFGAIFFLGTAIFFLLSIF